MCAGASRIGNYLHVIAEAVIGQFLVLGGRQRIRLDHRGRAPELEVPLELDGKAVDLEERGLAHGALQLGQALQVVGVIPIDVAPVQVGPVGDGAHGQIQVPAAEFQQVAMNVSTP